MKIFVSAHRDGLNGHRCVEILGCTVIDFGYYPDDLSINTGQVRVSSLPSREAATVDVSALSQRIHNDWIYPPQMGVETPTTGEFRANPFPTRIFSLPRTHQITHTNLDSDDQLEFHIWSLSFFTGMRLTSTEAGFLDATPIKPNKLNDFVLLGDSLSASVELAERFWCSNQNKPEQPKRFAAATHSLFLAQYPQALQFESFNYLYTALDSCYRIKACDKAFQRDISHPKRVKWLCEELGIDAPDWARPENKETVLSKIRNPATHEGLYEQEPLGFALHGIGDSNQNLNLEMQALICRLLVAIIASDSADYVRSPVNTRNQHGLKLT